MTVVSDLGSVRPKLRQDTAFLLSGDVTYVRNGDGAAVIKGRSAYRWLLALAHHLNGEFTVDELCRDLPEAQRGTVATLVSMLVEQGFARNAEPEAGDVLPAEVRERFAAQLQFIEHFADRPAARFAAFRSGRVLLIGGGEVLLAVGAALLRNGLARLTIAAPPSPTGSPAAGTHAPGTQALRALAVEAESLTAAGCPAGVSLLDGVQSDGVQVDSLAGIDIAGMDIVAYCADDISLGDVYDINERCHRAGVPFLPLVVIGGRAVIGPLTRRGGPCWTCALLRITTNSDPAEAATAWREIAMRSLPPTRPLLPAAISRMLGNGVGFEIFARLAGHLPGDVESGVVIQDLDTLSSVRETLLAHPLCPVCADPAGGPGGPADLWVNGLVAEDAAAAQDPTEAPTEEAPTAGDLYEHGDRLFGRHAGPLREFIDEPLTQIPLKVGSVRLRDPGGDFVPLNDATAFDVDDLRAARTAATAMALAVYSQRLFDPRRAVVGSLAELELAGRHPVPPEQILTWSGAVSIGVDERLCWLAGRRLDDGQVCLVPAGAVYPGSRPNSDFAWEQTEAGLAAAASSTRAAGLGLISALAYVRLRDLVLGAATVVELDGDHLGMADPRLGFLIRSAGHLGHRVRVLETLGAGGVHVHLTASTDTAEPVWAVGFGRSGGDAALAALRTLVGRLQLAETAAGAYGGQLLADLTPGIEMRFVDLASSRFTEPPVATGELLRQVRASGRAAVIADVTPPDVAGTGPIRVCRVLLVDGAAGRSGPTSSNSDEQGGLRVTQRRTHGDEGR